MLTTLLLCYARTNQSLPVKLSVDLNNILCWCRRNCLEINHAKTNYMIFFLHPKTPSYTPVISLGQYTIPATNKCTFLGAILDPNLKVYRSYLAYQIKMFLRNTNAPSNAYFLLTVDTDIALLRIHPHSLHLLYYVMGEHLPHTFFAVATHPESNKSHYNLQFITI